MFDPILGSQSLKESYIDYITTRFNIANQTYAKAFRSALSAEDTVAKGPFLDIGGSFKAGRTLQDMIDSGEAAFLFQNFEPIPEKERELKLERKLYLHQEKAMTKAGKGKNLVVTTGTGSGKTECFLLPVFQSLLQEEEAGTLTPGVRAIIIYPMNALASDQMKRMRKLLQGHPSITFGLYNGNTKHSEKDALAAYQQTHKDEHGDRAFPLSNELISREVMQETPPNILITNYSMLEYMLLRPKDDAVFKGSQLKFIVLDEAHIYKGATGMETALLMRRLRARIAEPDRVQYILTSATLGGPESDNDIITFANRLCGAPFHKDDIIRSQEKTVELQDSISLPPTIFEELYQNQSNISDILKRYDADFAPAGTYEEKLYALFLHSDLFADMRQMVKQPITLSALHQALSVKHNLSPEQLVAFVAVCAQAEYNGANLIKPRYHYFVRALEGMYIGVGETKELYLQRKTSILKSEITKTTFEAAVCSHCGRLALVGVIDGNNTLQQTVRHNDADYFFVKEQSDGVLLDYNDETSDNEKVVESDYVVCSLCGTIDTEASLHFRPLCDHDKSHYVYLKKARMLGGEESRKRARCPACEFGYFTQVYLGAEAATAVLGTALFELLPKEETLTIDSTPEPERKSIFAKRTKPKQDIRTIMPQFLCFSDSRSEAAFFASYMEESYKEFLRRRGMWHVAEKLRNEGRDVVAMSHFAKELSLYFEKNRTFAEWDKPTASVTFDSKHHAWVGILNEMFNARRATSLIASGVISFEYSGNDDLAQVIQETYDLDAISARSLLELLVQDIVYSGAIYPGDGEILDAAEHEYIFYSKMPKKMVLLKEGGSSSKKWTSGWCARKRTTGTYFPNARLARLIRDLSISEDEANAFLEEYWGVLTDDFELKDGEFSLSADAFRIRLGSTAGSQFFRCQKCGKVTPYSVKNNCSSIKCTGTLVAYDPLEKNEHNHYANLYQGKSMAPLHIKEHTAQLSKDQQTRYQEAFLHKKIHALSCSTTFEMGVDLGSLETVYLRDVPPSPANYVQRAGRAGRGKNAAAFVLTFAKLSSHDFTYYQDPIGMISGKINVPLFNLENEKILKRHIFAVALSAFFAEHPEIYDGNNQSTFLNENGYEALKDYLSPVPAELSARLLNSIPKEVHTQMGLLDDSWVNLLCGDDGVLELAVRDFRKTVESIQDGLKQARKQHDDAAAAQWSRTLAGFRCSKEDNNGKNKKPLIDFLVRNNVLPKYGFPVDTVELSPNILMGDRQQSVQLLRDLQMAIADYAPGSEVVADGKVYTSRYLRKMPGRSKSMIWEEGSYCPECPSCKQPNFTKEPLTLEGRPCVSCHTNIPKRRWGKTIEPRMGFYADKETKKVPMHRPERDFKTDDYYIGDAHRNIIEKHSFKVNNQVVHIESTANDSLVVIGQTNYAVCPVCGYTDSVTVKPGHKNTQGYVCTNTKEIKPTYQLSHDFKTDVVKLSFVTPESTSKNTMLSVLYAVLEGLSREMGIERTDLKGCLFQTKSNSFSGYSLVLYDGVAGGAGHVRRLVTHDGSALKKVLKQALQVVGSCNCDSSCYQCIRNYYNQKIHDKLSRKKAAEFLENWMGAYALIAEDAPDSPQLPEATLQIESDTRADEYSSWSGFGQANSHQDIVKHWDALSIPMDCVALPTMQLNEEIFEPYVVWEASKVAVFEDIAEWHVQPLQALGWVCLDIHVPSETLQEALQGD